MSNADSYQVPEEARLQILIVGAGLSGIAAAISCAISGHSVQVIEQARELAEVSFRNYGSDTLARRTEKIPRSVLDCRLLLMHPVYFDIGIYRNLCGGLLLSRRL